MGGGGGVPIDSTKSKWEQHWSKFSLKKFINIQSYFIAELGFKGFVDYKNLLIIGDCLHFSFANIKWVIINAWMNLIMER